MSFSEVHAAESVAYLNRALARLQDIWEEIGIPEEQRLQRTNEVHKHIKVSLRSVHGQVLVLFDRIINHHTFLFPFPSPKGLLDLMIAEEEELKKRLLKSIESCVKELSILYSELQLPPFEVRCLRISAFSKIRILSSGV